MKIIGPNNLVKFLGERVPEVMNVTPQATFQISVNDPRSISFNSEYTELNISALGIDNLTDNYNKIGLLQSFYRFIGINAVSEGYFLMHAAAAIFHSKAVVFGDNGKAVGKTLSSIEMGLDSHQYIGDEFIFLNSNNFEIFTDKEIPIHLRPEVRAHLDEKHGLRNLNEFVSQPDLRMEHVNNLPMDALCYLNFIKDKSEERIIKLDHTASKEYALITLSAHVKKMLDPSLDRFQFIARSDSSNAHDVASGVKNEHSIYYNNIEKYFVSAAALIADKIPSYELFVVDPCSVPVLLATVI